MPGPFQIRRPASRMCELAAETELELVWSEAPGAWAYVSETLIRGLRAPLADRGIELETDPLPLLGLSLSASDTTIVFPSEFGLLDRVDTESEVLVALQGGLPPGTSARVWVAAVDRNYVNWLRGGNFNPSGQVRVGSLEGDGTGFFGSAFLREMTIWVDVDDVQAPACHPDGP